mmetsp:Transcript_15961/g.35933  ORF Transcript_15961/g.35933 Transcript_15961/m.35933 type:complete len:238 (-) Transcript_15961:194-907(-)
MAVCWRESGTSVDGVRERGTGTAVPPHVFPLHIFYRLDRLKRIMRHGAHVFSVVARELLYTEDDVTRSSPFFWAFRKAFPSESDQIFSITDSIPAPVKEIGPAFQTIEVEGDGSRPEGSLISRVKVATLGGVATSIMTTRCTILGGEGRDSLRIRVDSTKPEDSTVLKGLGPLGEFLNDNGPAFPSGDALDKAAPGSAEVVIQTTYCDENLRISRNMMRPDDYFIFIRKSFQGVFDV